MLYPSSFPIDPVLPDLKEAVRAHPAVILRAPPGSGKTTRVPLALLEISPRERPYNHARTAPAGGRGGGALDGPGIRGKNRPDFGIFYPFRQPGIGPDARRGVK